MKVYKMPKFVAELSINHLGNRNIAINMIDSAVKSGADYIKLKIKDVDTYYRDKSPQNWRNFSFIDYRKSLELNEQDFDFIDDYCSKRKIKWFATIHDEKSLAVIRKYKSVDFYKLASMDILDEGFLKAGASASKIDGKTLIISVGGQTLDEIKRSVKIIEGFEVDLIILHTVSIYPTPDGKNNITFIERLKKEFEGDKINIGFSSHEIGCAASIIASIQKVIMIERHFTISKDLNIHHIKVALLPDEFSNMIKIIAQIIEELNSESTEYFEKEFEFLRERNYS
jgi:sialic acid synthase SpsE